MDVLAYRNPPPPFFSHPNISNIKLLDPQHDAEYIVPLSKQHFYDPPSYRKNYGWSSNAIHGPDTYYYHPPPPRTNINNIWLDKNRQQIQNNHDRIRNWLSEQHEFAGYPPPEEESICSLRSSSAVEVLSNEREPLNNFPKYRSEERIHATHHETEEQRSTALRRRYNSPDCIRRRYFSPRSDPNLNIAGNQHYLTARSSSYKHLPPLNDHENNTEFLNRAFYQGGKGNTFPRRAANRNTSRNLLNIPSKEEMGQNMEKYQHNVLLNHHANKEYHSNNIYNPYITENIKKIEEPLLAGRTFVLNGITLQNKRDIDEKTDCIDKDESAIISSVENNPIASTEVTESETIKENDKESSKNSDKTLSKNSDNSEKSTPVINHNIIASFHTRVASAPATTDSNKLHRDLYWRNDEAKRRVSCEVRKVKALSWPKRAILPENTPDKKFVESYTKKMRNSTSNCDIQEDEGRIEEVDGVNEDASSDHSDIPPARPPLPPEHMYVKRDGSHSSGDRTSSKRSREHSETPREINEETIVPETKNDMYRLNEDRECVKSIHSSEEAKSVSSEQFYHHSSCELSKRVSISLKDLIKIHEKEIARVSGAFSTRTLDKIEEKSRKTSFTREERKTHDQAKWKRHTTIGLLGDFSHETIENYPEDHIALSDQNQNELNDYQIEENDNEDSSFPPISPTSIPKKLSIAVSSRTSNESEVNPLSPKQNIPPPLTLPKPKKVMTSSMVTSPLQTVVSPQYSPQQHEGFQIPAGTSYTSCMSDSSVQTEDRLVRSPSFRRNEMRLQELTEENENIKRGFEEERKLLNKKLQEQTKLANAYQKLEDRYRKKVYDLQKAMKMCTCSNGRYSTFQNRDGDHYRPDDASVGDSNEISVQKVDVILNKLEAWLNHHTTGITYPESEISSLFGSTHEDIYTRNNKRPTDYYGGGVNGTIPLDRIIDRIDATSV